MIDSARAILESDVTERERVDWMRIHLPGLLDMFETISSEYTNLQRATDKWERAKQEEYAAIAEKQRQYRARIRELEQRLGG